MKPDDIIDIRGPISIPYWWIPYAIAAGVLLALCLAVAAYRAIRKYRRARAESAAEIALRRIAHAQALLATHSSAEFSAEVSDAVRVYIEARFALRAAHRTTEEFLHELLTAEASPITAHREALDDFLSWCDLAKFARLALTPSHADAIIDSARRFVEATASPSAPTQVERRSSGSASSPALEVGT